MSKARRHFTYKGEFPLHRGGALHDPTFAYETWGKLNAERTNAVLIFTGLSPSAHAASSSEDGTPGWWEDMVGPGRAISPRQAHLNLGEHPRLHLAQVAPRRLRLRPDELGQRQLAAPGHVRRHPLAQQRLGAERPEPVELRHGPLDRVAQHSHDRRRRGEVVAEPVRHVAGVAKVAAQPDPIAGDLLIGVR